MTPNESLTFPAYLLSNVLQSMGWPRRSGILRRPTVAGCALYGALGEMAKAGIAIGAASGALIGKSLGNGVDKKFIKDVKEALTPGSSAILFIISHENTGILISALEPYSGKIYQSSFDSEAEAEIRKALQ